MLCTNSIYHGDEGLTITDCTETTSNPLLLTIEDLMGQEWDVYTKKDQNLFCVQLTDSDQNETEIKKLNEGCMESLAHFCRSFLLSYEYANKEDESC